MGATLTALNANAGVKLVTVIIIEGCPYALTDADPQTITSLLASATLPGHLDIESSGDVVGGLTVHWDQGQKIEPWKPFPDPPTLSFSVTATGTIDAFGELVGKRQATSESPLVEDLDCNDTTLYLRRVDDFGASGTVYIGPEAVAYTTRDTGADTLTGLTRGKFNPFHTDGGSRFARTHKPINLSTSTGDPIGVRLQPIAASSPTDWIGRWVGVWLLRQPGEDTTPDVPDTDGHLAFAGTIAEIGEDEQGRVVVQCESVQRRIYETVLNPQPFTAKLKGGLYLQAGQTFSAEFTRQISGGGTTLDSATDLTVTVGASGATQIEVGLYTAQELADAINRWLAAEIAAARCRYQIVGTSEGTRSVVTFDDITTTSGLDRELVMSFPTDGIADFMGWNSASVVVASSTSRAQYYSPHCPLRIQIPTFSNDPDRLYTVGIEDARGIWQSQQASLPPSMVDSNQQITGIMRVADLGYMRVQYISDTQIAYNSQNLGSYLPSVAGALPGRYTLDDDVDLRVSQVILMEGQFNSLLPKLLASTGASAFNHPTYDSLSEGLGCAIPWSILGDSFENDLNAIASAEKGLRIFIDKPMRMVDLLESEFLVRGCFFRWGNGYLGMGSWQAPASTLASVTLDETSKAVPYSMSEGDAQRASLREDDGSLYNVVSFRYGFKQDGSYTDIYTIEDARSIRTHGTRSRTIDLSNADLAATTELLREFKQLMPLFSRPFYRIKRTIAQTHFEQARIGTVALLTDKYLRDPTTGLRYSHVTGTGGVSSQPVLVIGNEFSWGGSGDDTAGEVELMLVPRLRTAGYVPCAQVDDTATNAGYDAGTKVLTCYAHEHSGSSETADAARFAAGDAVRVVEIDPDNPASPTTWLDTVASQSGNTITLTTGLAGWDTTKKYRVIYDSYANCTATQQAKAFWADDADGLVVDSRGPYEMVGYQGSNFTSVTVATDLAVRHSTLAYSEGNPIDTGYERDIARNLNNFREYKSSPQCPQTYTTARSYSSGTWTLVEVVPIFLQLQTMQVWQTRRVSVSPLMRSTTGATAECRITLAPLLPTGSTRADVSRTSPYVSATFTTTSTTFNVPTAQTLDIRHCLSNQSGVAYLLVEIKTATEYKGLARRKLGPVETV